MKSKTSPAVVGLFILGALLLALIGFLSFGGSNIFSKPSRFLIYFDESVSGLDPGAAVKISGVRIGRVVAINVRYDATIKSSLVQTICEIDRNVVTDSAGKTIDLTDTAELQTLVDRGLRARLNLTGITGLLYVDLTLEDPNQYPANPKQMADTYPVVPAIPSAISEIQQSVVEIIASIKKVDFPGLGKELKTLLTSTNRKVNELDVKALTEKVGAAADSVSQFVNAPEVKQTFVNLNGAITDLRGTLAKIDAQVEPAGAELTKTLVEAQDALAKLAAAGETTRTFVQAQGNVGEDVSRTLRQLSEAAESVQRLADFLERNPNALVTGRKRRP